MRGTDIFGATQEPLTLTHDCLEHFAFGSVADEIEAHGAMYWIRYGFTLDVEAFANEWDSLLRALMTEGYLPDVPKTRTLDSDVEDDISAIIEQGRAYCVRNVIDGDLDYADDSRRDLDRLANAFRAFFRRGYRKAARRYKGLAACEVAALFDSLQNAFAKVRLEFEGQSISVNVDLRTQSVRIDEIIPKEFD